MLTVQETPEEWRAIDWQRHSRVVKLEGDALSYVELGAGDPVLLIHGLGGNWTAWLETIPALARRYRVIAVDLPGFGGSAPSGNGISVTGYSRTLSHLLEELAVDNPVVVGSSLGGWVAADLTLRSPDRVRALVLVDAAGIVPTSWERLKALAMMEGAARMAPYAPRFRSAVASRRRLRAWALRYTIDRPEELAADLVYMALPAAPDPGFRPALVASKRSWSDAWCDRLTEIDCPTLIIWGARDSLLPLRHGREYARRIVTSRLHVIPDAGHLPMIERPRECNQLMLEFIEEVGEPVALAPDDGKPTGASLG
jgi:pimeloyl-ACP methyl ester carboxylesterase